MSAPVPDDLIAKSADRRGEVRARHHNGLDLVEVAENNPRHLILMFLEQAPHHVEAGNIRIDGPPTAPRLTVTAVRLVAATDPRLRDYLLAELSGDGGEGAYRISVVEARPDGTPGTTPLRGLDPRFVSATIRFDIDQPAPSAPTPTPAAKPRPAAAPSYLARDYQGLRTLLLDRLSNTLPDFPERHIPDVVIALVELFAYLGDDLSYYQDAVATEAYLQTARRRTSVRRHARLLAYPFHDGCHARAWIDVRVNADCDLVLNTVSFTAATPGGLLAFVPLRASLPPPYAPGETEPGRAPRRTVVPLRLAHNEIHIWDWGESTTYLPAGATEATLVEPDDTTGALQLQPGDLLLFEELHADDGGPPDETHRHTVRLTRAEHSTDPLYGTGLLEIAWDPLDALPFALPVSVRATPTDTTIRCAVARANLVLAGAGQRVTAEELPADARTLSKPDLTWSCPYPDLERVARHQAVLLRTLYDAWRAQMTRWRRRARRGHALDDRQRDQLRTQFGRELVEELGLGGQEGIPAEEQADFDAIALWVLLARAGDLLDIKRRRLLVLARLAAASGPLSGPLLAEIRADWGADLTCGLDPHHPASWGPALDATTQDPTRARPLLALTDAHPDASGATTAWDVTTGLVDAEPEAPRVIVEMDNDRTAHLRFNPATEPQTPLQATYVVGNGAAGNVAAEAINGYDGAPAAVIAVRNPLPAVGGRDPETLSHARRAIPGAYLDNQPRALTPADYVRIAKTVPGVRNAAAALHWNGNRIEIRLAVQPGIGEDPDAMLLHRVEHTLIPVRRIGHDLHVSAPDYRAVAITLTVELDPDAIRDTTRQQISQLLGSATLPDGTPAFFHPSRFSFGAQLYPSALVAAVQELPGIASVHPPDIRFVRAVPQPPTTAIPPTAIIRCDNDPAAPENGYAQLTLVGGR